MSDETVGNPDPNVTAQSDPAIVEAAAAPAPEPVAPATLSPVVSEPEPPAEGPADPLTQVLVDFNADGQYTVVTLSPGEPKNRQLVIGGVSVEHVGEDVSGRWKFRRM